MIYDLPVALLFRAGAGGFVPIGEKRPTMDRDSIGHEPRPQPRVFIHGGIGVAGLAAAASIYGPPETNRRLGGDALASKLFRQLYRHLAAEPWLNTLKAPPIRSTCTYRPLSSLFPTYRPHPRPRETLCGILAMLQY